MTSTGASSWPSATTTGWSWPPTAVAPNMSRQTGPSRARLCWHATRTPSSRLRGMRLTRHRKRPYQLARLTRPIRIAPRWVLTSRRSSRLDAAAQSPPTPRRVRFLICQEPGPSVVTGEDLLVDRLVASHHRLGREALLDPGPQGCVLGPPCAVNSREQPRLKASWTAPIWPPRAGYTSSSGMP